VHDEVRIYSPLAWNPKVSQLFVSDDAERVWVPAVIFQVDSEAFVPICHYRNELSSYMKQDRTLIRPIRKESDICSVRAHDGGLKRFPDHRRSWNWHTNTMPSNINS
jgi:hypothetical protein